MKLLRKVGILLKNILFNLLNRLKPRSNFGWIFSFVLWLFLILYLVIGSYFGIQIYKYKSTSKVTVMASLAYPYPAAIVNGKVIWANSFFKELGYLHTFSSKTKQTIPDDATLRIQIIDQLAENKIISYQALKYNVHISRQDFNYQYQKIQENAGGLSEMKKVLHELYSMSESNFKQHVYAQILKQKVRTQVMQQVKVVHIFIKDEKRANDVAKQLRDNGNFADLAKQYSQDTNSRDNGGEIGWLERGQLQADGKTLPEFDQAVFAAKIGDIVGPVKTSAGFEIVKVEGFKGVLDQNFDSWLTGLKQQAHIWRFIK